VLAVANGTIAWSSRLVVEVDPAEVSTPTIVNGMLLIVTLCPTTSVLPNSSVAVGRGEGRDLDDARERWLGQTRDRAGDERGSRRAAARLGGRCRWSRQRRR